MRKTAQTNGASSGIGAKFARDHARKAGDMVLADRSMGPLAALATKLVAVSVSR